MQRSGIKSILGLMALFLMICISTLVISSQYILNIASKELESRMLNDRTAMLERLDTVLTSEMNTIRKQCLDLLVIDSIQAVAVYETTDSEDSFENVKNIWMSVSYLSNIVSQNELTSSVAVFLPATERLITNLSSYKATTKQQQYYMSAVADYPSGVFPTDQAIGLWISYPYYHTIGETNRHSSRFAFATLSSASLLQKLEDFQVETLNCQLELRYHDVLLARAGDLFTATDTIANSASSGEAVRVEQDGQSYLIIDTPPSQYEVSLRMILPLDIAMAEMHTVQFQMLIVNIISILLIVFLGITFCSLLYVPINRLLQGMRQLSDGDLNVRVLPHWSSEFNAVSEQFNSMANQLQLYIAREYDYKLLIKEAELKWLQYQINPHFLYNSYFQLRNLIYMEDYQNAEQLASLLGSYLRYIVRVKDGSTSLKEEVEHAWSYARIQDMRFHQRVDVQLSESDNEKWQSLHVPCLIIQPLIENAFEHGMKNMATNGAVHVRIQADEQQVLITVDDNGQELSDTDIEQLRQTVFDHTSSQPTGIALSNIHRRLRTAFGDNSGLLFQRSALGGLQAAIVIKPSEEKSI